VSARFCGDLGYLRNIREDARALFRVARNASETLELADRLRDAAAACILAKNQRKSQQASGFPRCGRLRHRLRFVISGMLT